MCCNYQDRVCFSEMIDLISHMPRFTWKINVFPSISLESTEMRVETLRTGFVFTRQSIWGVTCLGLLEKFMFSHLSPWKHHKCVLKPPEQGSFFSRWSIWGVTWPGLVDKNECFSIYLLGNCINGCWNSQNRARFSKTINFRGHMPRFTLKMNIFPSISLESP